MQPLVGTAIGTRSEPQAAPGIYAEGLLAGVAGAATIALAFLILDLINGRPLYTPNVLGAALLRSGEALAAPSELPISFELVLSFTWIHTLVFLVIGITASRLLEVAEREPSAAFGILLLFVVFEFGFVMTSMVLEDSVLDALGWQEVMAANLLAVAAMAAVLWHQHPRLTIDP